LAAITIYNAPEDGHKGRPKHVEHTCSFNKHNTARVASFWFIIYYINVKNGIKILHRFKKVKDKYFKSCYRHN